MFQARSSCDDYRALGMESGIYEIDPDGTGQGLAAFDVYCDMDSDAEEAITKLG